MTDSVERDALLVRSRLRLCALPASRVVETMRPLPVEPLAGTPEFIVGTARIRGEATPVVDLGVLLGASEPPAFARFVTLRSGDDKVALALEAVLGVRTLPDPALRRLPPLLRGASSDLLSALGTLDAELLSVLKLAKSLTDRVARALDTEART